MPIITKQVLKYCFLISTLNFSCYFAIFQYNFRRALIIGLTKVLHKDTLKQLRNNLLG